jgi:hypothetical protein
MATNDDQLYVFALAEPGLPRTLSVLGRTLRTISLGEIDAIVERHRAEVEPTPDALRNQHATVVRLADRTRALLPARFGSLIGADALQAIVSERAPEILESLARVRDRRQMTLRVFGALDRSMPIEEQRSTGTAFLKSRRERALHVPAEVIAIRDRLGSLVSAERVARGQGGLRVTIYHLVSTGEIESYKKRAAGLDFAPHQLTVSGPWPAFSFAPELF